MLYQFRSTTYSPTQQNRNTMNNHTTITPAVIDDVQAATYLGISPHWLRNNRRSPSAPPFIKIGGRIRYRVSSLDTWLQQQEVKN